MVGSVTATVVDLFSGAGGASAGFHAHPGFTIMGAADAQVGKPSTPRGSLACNSTYAANTGILPVVADLATVTPDNLAALMGLRRPPTVLISCPPCTGFSRTLADNHLRDDPRNHLVRRTGLFVREWMPKVLLMENARELVMVAPANVSEAATATHKMRWKTSAVFLAARRPLRSMRHIRRPLVWARCSAPVATRAMVVDSCKRSAVTAAKTPAR